MGMRRLVQVVSALLTNAYYKGFSNLTIYQGPAKQVCVPVLNCYSCPGALGSCPVGSMQALLASYQHQFSLYVAGFLTAVAAASGRLACGWLCPFGLIQELLASFPTRKYDLPSFLRLLKYPILLLTLLLPVLWVNQAGIASPYFCKYLCPAGTLEGGIPLGLGRPELRALLGGLFSWKMAVLIIFIVTSIFVFRPFCRTMCPLGTFYGFFNPISLWRLEVNAVSCTSCGQCTKACPVNIDVPSNPNSPECFRCMQCKDACPTGAICFTHSGDHGPVKVTPQE